MDPHLEDEILFKHRNRSYGAYLLRRSYIRNLTISVVLALIFFFTAFMIAVELNKNIEEEDYYDFSNVVFEYSSLEYAPGEIPKAPENTNPPEKKLNIAKTENLNEIKVKETVANTENTLEDNSTSDADSLNGNPNGEGNGSDTGLVFTRVQEIPMYPGGEDARKKFIKEHFNYASLGQNVKIQGVVWVSFIVEKDGSLSAIKVLNGIGAACDGEVVKVVKKMPKWKPGKRNGLPVRVILKMPIRFENAI
ncbi:MAG TPA: TonB family protein [Bacteroidales bacterium]|nr:TonB family protein [Bacteroidales bacterium]HPS17276.1 TonB family protein [Bacteroidales bacterium]